MEYLAREAFSEEYSWLSAAVVLKTIQAIPKGSDLSAVLAFMPIIHIDKDVVQGDREGVQTVVIGDIRDIRQDLDVGSKNNQKLHQWSHGQVRHLLTYKAERLGMAVALQEESYTSKTCPVCGQKRKSKPVGRVFHCPNKKCGFTWHRDGVGACNIRRKYLDLGPVVGVMAPPTGMRFNPHARVAQREKAYR